MRHAHTHLLKPTARSVPHRATVYAQLVECDYLWRCHDLAGVEADIGDGLLLASTEAKQGVCGSSGVMHVDALDNSLHLISGPFKVFEFDFNKAPAYSSECELQVSISKAGTVHALISWWLLQLDEEGTILYSTAPKWIEITAEESCWRDHWKQYIWYFPGKGFKVAAGDTVHIKAVHDEISVRYVMDSQTNIQPGIRQDGPFMGQGDDGYHYNLVTRPERIGFLGDRRFRRIIREALMRAVEGKSSPLCLIVDDSMLCTIMASLVNPNGHIVAMLPGLRHDGFTCMKAIAKANRVTLDCIHIFGKKAVQLCAKDLKDRKVDIFIAEPYYRAYEDLLPWRHLRFWYERTSLAPLLADHATIIPCQGILRGIAVFLPDLWHSRKALTAVEGFDHSPVNHALGACGDLSSPLEGPLLPYSLWQCGQCKELTESFSVMTFDFSLLLHSVEGSVKVPVSSSGLCHAIVLWMDWVVDSEKNLVLSTGPSGAEPTYWKQGIKLLSSPLQLSGSSLSENSGMKTELLTNQSHCSELLVSAVFSPHTGDLEINVNPFVNSL